MARTEVRTIFTVFHDDRIMAVSLAFPWGVTPYLPEAQCRRTQVFILFLAYSDNWTKVTSALQTI